jgi:4-(gamma-glutamylamino)butanal dehydrogenase
MPTRTLDYWTARASQAAPRGQAFIGGDFTDAASGETFPAVSPATGTHLADVAACDEADVDRAVAAARASFESGAWSGGRSGGTQAGAASPGPAARGTRR